MLHNIDTYMPTLQGTGFEEAAYFRATIEFPFQDGSPREVNTGLRSRASMKNIDVDFDDVVGGYWSLTIALSPQQPAC